MSHALHSYRVTMRRRLVPLIRRPRARRWLAREEWRGALFIGGAVAYDVMAHPPLKVWVR